MTVSPTAGFSPDYVVDQIQALTRGGKGEPSNMKFSRGGWTVRLSAAQGFIRGNYQGVFRETLRQNSRGARRPCLQFTVFKDKESDEAIVQLQMFDDGSVRSWGYEPCMVRLSYWKKLIVIGVFKPTR